MEGGTHVESANKLIINFLLEKLLPLVVDT